MPWVLPRDSVHRLMEEFLHDFHFKSSFDIESSLFDHGKLRYGTRRITLREHFRLHAGNHSFQQRIYAIRIRR